VNANTLLRCQNTQRYGDAENSNDSNERSSKLVARTTIEKRQKAAGEDMGFQHLKSREILEGE